ncbi:ornithine carbamoyltransferase [Hydrogenobacter thermophilus TK-6]|uniref:Ornithine carbamoyltransferase n=1 Tax=Hydrogenobacter thermophilus (strain DSM 6534 / IAM 12695 / TK-6) TaxID=608538 RepID=D3DIK2_HYDTT|nr:ornithine carbamoyltransferase [Hydrogenobacter thermophilus]ADO45580.1 ornithine carbamoyltransferase [Hydrogenobacter thermophilus TK-6]BAI69654.1 ornithine carbamoyltransferase [Hydrogenobacter thermophilus TK-6]
MIRNFVDLWEITPDEGWAILLDAESIKTGRDNQKYLLGKNVGLFFTKPSTRTRVSFEVAVHQLGGNAIYLAEQSLQVSRGEDLKDTSRTLSRYLDCIVIRTDSHRKLEEYARYSTVPVINALTDMSHPCQVLSDVFTLYETFQEDLRNIKIAYVGDGNNVCNTWLVAAGLFGLNLFVATPEGYEPSSYYYQAGEDLCKITGGSIYLTTNPVEAVKDAHVVYTDVWVSMNQERDEEKLNLLKPYQVNQKLLSYARSDVKVMHCLPARKGEEITEDVFEAHADFIFRQAENRLHAQKALLKFLLV